MKGTPEEIAEAFADVDVDGSGVVTFKEFAAAIQGSRMAELNVSMLLTKMDGTLDNLGKYMEKIGNRYKSVFFLSINQFSDFCHATAFFAPKSH